MKILITGSRGFLGKNLIARLNEDKETHEIYEFDIGSTLEELNEYTKKCDFVFNFAAVHRPKNVEEFDKVNHVFFDDLLEMLKAHGNKCPVLYTSSIQATNGTEYGNSKLSSEADLRAYAKETGARGVIYRLSNVFGRWATPNHHSVVATFCNNLVNDLPIFVSDPTRMMNFHYIDDVMDSFMAQLKGDCTPDNDGIFRVGKIYDITLKDLADTLMYFKDALSKGQEPCLDTEIKKALYITYSSYLQNKGI